VKQVKQPENNCTSAARRFPTFQSRNACWEGAQYGCNKWSVAKRCT